jgi:hypothetical protein
VSGETWVYQNGTWTQEHPATSPAPRTGAALVYDAASGQLLLFGGSSKIGTEGGYFGDTWVWTGTTWLQLHPATSPPARHNADMIYDAADQDVVLFGGYDGQYLGDTWTWNGSAWTQLSTTASPGQVQAGWQMADDPATSQMLLFGGHRQRKGTNSGATWVWTGITWTELKPAASPFGRSYGSLTYDSATQQIILFGGQGYRDVKHPDTPWVWNGTTWQNVS